MRRLRAPGVPEAVVDGLLRLQKKLDLPSEFSQAATAQAEALAANPPSFADHVDRTDLAFITIDPPSSMDLDQAMFIERDGDGYVVHYAIADVAAWVEPGSPIAEEAWVRGQTMYAPSAKVPLHPAALSEGAASLLADGVARPAMVWTHRLDASGSLLGSTLERAMVLNSSKLSYEDIDQQLASGTASATAELLAEVGALRVAIEVERGGINLNLPDQEIVATGNTWELQFRTTLDVEEWNAQVSLMTGIAAAHMMVDGGVGILRTLPPAHDSAVARLRRIAKSLHVEWPRDVEYPDFVRALDPANPRELAVIVKCTTLFRGAGYMAFVNGVPEGNLEHAAVASLYAHTTAPLRRLVDRFVLEVCHSLSRGIDVPVWAVEALDGLPERMQESGQSANAYERGAVDLAEALAMADKVGQVFDAVLIDVYPKNNQGTFQITEFAIEARIADMDQKDVGKVMQVRLDNVDLLEGEVHFSLVSDGVQSVEDESAR